MFNKVLVANRGNIAVNIIRACRELGIETVAVYSDVDKEAIHVRYADKAYYLGEAKYGNDYRKKDLIIDLALKEKVDAIHPGFGFLSQNLEFLSQCEENRITVIGESSGRMKEFSDKMNVRKTAEDLGIPVINACMVSSAEEAASMKTPFLFKPVSGYAGRGIQYVEDKEDLRQRFEVAEKEAQYLFGDNRIYAEEYIENTYLIEVCVASDGREYVALPTTDSSLRRRFQKIVAEAPAEYISLKIRKQISEYAKRLAQELEIKSLANFEFLVSGKKIYFLEFNPRLPVSYGVLEMLTGFNLIKEQFNLASGGSIGLEEIPLEKIKGNAFECRVFAEDYQDRFKPSSGRIEKIILPGGKDVRVEFDYFHGDEVSSWYDSQLARLSVRALRRNEMVNKIRWVLFQTKITGISSTLPFLRNVVNTKLFSEGRIVSDFITHVMRERRFKKVRENEYIAAIVSSLSFLNENRKENIAPRINMGSRDYSPWNIIGRSKIIKKWE